MAYTILQLKGLGEQAEVEDYGTIRFDGETREYIPGPDAPPDAQFGEMVGAVYDRTLDQPDDVVKAAFLREFKSHGLWVVEPTGD